MNDQAFYEIKKWLDITPIERDYLVGIELYRKYGNDNRLKMRVFIPQNKFEVNKRTLAYELGKLIKGYVPSDIKKGSGLNKKQKTKSSATDKPSQKQETEPIPTTTQGHLKKEFPQIIFSDLPDMLKILVVDRISLFSQANEARKKKLDASTNEERAKFNVIEIDCRNKNQLIWNELNHFQKYRKVLGKHPKFKQENDLAKLNKLSREQLISKKNNFASARSKANKSIKKNPDKQDLIAQKKKLLKKYDWEEKEVDRLLNIN